MLVTLAARRDAELKVVDALLQVSDAVVWLLLVIRIFAVDIAEVIIAGRAFELEFGTLQVVVIALVLSEKANAAAVLTLHELLGALAEVAKGFIVSGLVRAVLGTAAEFHCFQILFGIAVHFDHLDRLVALAALWAGAAALGPGCEAIATIGRVAVGAFDRVHDDHRADRAAEVL